MSSSMNRQSNPTIIQSSNSLSVQAPSSNVMTNAPNSNRNRALDGSSRRRYRNVRGSVTSTGSTCVEEQQHQHQTSHHHGGRRGRGGSTRGRSGGRPFYRRDTDQRVTDKPTVDSPSNEVLLANETNLSQDHPCQDGSEIKQKQEPVEIANLASVKIVDNTSSEDAQAAESSTKNHGGGPITNQPVNKSKSTRGVGGKYKQRRETRQLIDGLDGLDLDLFESLTPSNADGSGRSHTTNTRKINLSHFVNYSYERKNRVGTNVRHDSLSGRRYTDRLGGQHQNHNNNQYRYHNHHSNEHKFNKQQFLQANCQFVVLDGYDYTIHKVNPDWPVEWDCIEEVKFRQIGATETTCPICLEPPVAAKITKCGHIYCWACMLRYLSMSDDNNVPCPICFEPIYVSDLRSVVSQSYVNYKVGDEISMKLMFRRKGCVEVGPRSSPSPNLDHVPAIKVQTDTSNIKENNPHYSSRANLLIVDPITIVEQVAQREKNELQSKLELESAELVANENDLLADKNYSGMICFIEQALEKVDKRINRLVQMYEESRILQIEAQKFPTAESTMESDPTWRSYLFYQSGDGQHIYLNPFSTKILCHEYGSLENCPLEIRAEVLQMDWISMNEACRKRFRYLEHLPLTCEFRLIEIDFEKSNLISKETFQAFEEQINLRAKERARRLREEAKRDKQIQVEQNRKIYGIQPSLEISLDNQEQFPSVLNERHTEVEETPRIPDGEDGQDQILINHSGRSRNEVGSDPTDGVTLSFAEIQLQEAAKAEEVAKQQKKQQQNNKSHWAGPSNRQKEATRQSATQSSFAQLLVNAKSSQQKWTKSAGSSSSTTTTKGTANSSQQAPTSNQQRLQIANDSDDGNEELRAPPCEFSMSDYLDMNLISSKKRSKKKKS